MTLNQFQAVKPELTATLAASMAAALVQMGQDALQIDMLSMQPYVDAWPGALPGPRPMALS